jgi:DNA gyrase subunit B
MPDSPDRRPNPVTEPNATSVGAADGDVPPELEIKILTMQEAVRKRPAMYLGDTGLDGPYVLLHELISNAMGEFLAGSCKNIQVMLHADDSASVADDGRGIPVGPHPHFDGLDRLEVVLTKPHA